MTDTTGITYRMTGADLTALANWQNGLRSSSTTANGIMTEWAFVGEGASGEYNPDTLTSAVLTLQGQFRWVNHTYTHQNLDAPLTAAQTLNELAQNDAVATNQLHLSNYSKDAFINPDISGLYNPEAQQGLATFGIKYEISDTSRPGWNNPSPNAGFYSVYQPSLLIIPRRPTNLFYNLATPAQWVSEYNCYYGPTGTCAGGAWRFWDHNLTYAEILDKESDMMLQYMLKWDIRSVDVPPAEHGRLRRRTLDAGRPDRRHAGQVQQHVQFAGHQHQRTQPGPENDRTDGLQQLRRHGDPGALHEHHDPRQPAGHHPGDGRVLRRQHRDLR